MKEGAYLYLRIMGENLDFLYLTKKTGLVPTVTHRKGDDLSVFGQNFFCETDCWQADYRILSEQTLEEAVIQFLDDCLKNNKRFPWPNSIQVDLWLSIYPEERYTSLRFTKKVITMLDELDVNLCVVTTDLSDFYMTGDVCSTGDGSPS